MRHGQRWVFSEVILALKRMGGSRKTPEIGQSTGRLLKESRYEKMEVCTKLAENGEKKWCKDITLELRIHGESVRRRDQSYFTSKPFCNSDTG